MKKQTHPSRPSRAKSQPTQRLEKAAPLGVGVDVEIGKPIGLTQDVGYQIGARKTFAVSSQRAWATLTSKAGLKLWLGDVDGFQFVPGHTYQTKDGAVGEIRVVQAGDHLRMTWQPKRWKQPSTIQVRVMSNGDKSIISFHQDNLAGPAERKQMYLRWQKVLQALPALLAAQP